MDASMATQLIRRRTIQAVGRLNTPKPKETRTQTGTSVGAMEIFGLSNSFPRPPQLPPFFLRDVAGMGGPSGFFGDGGIPTSARLRIPTALAFDRAGNLYIADRGNHRIRKITKSTNIITTIAGNGTPAPATGGSQPLFGGYSGDGSDAFNCRLNTPHVVALDRFDNIYIADTLNNRIRKIDAITNRITTIAGSGVTGYTGDGGPANLATLHNPYGLAFDRAGHLYFSDSSNHVIRKVDAITNIITTIAGNGTPGFSGDDGDPLRAQLNDSNAITFDRAGNLYIADKGNNRIRKITASTGRITTVAGNGVRSVMAGPRVYNGDDIFARSASLHIPIGVAVDRAGNIYIAEESEHRLRKVDAYTGKITTVAGNGVRGYNGNNILATSAQLRQPYGVAIDSFDNIYIVDTISPRIRQLYYP